MSGRVIVNRVKLFTFWKMAISFGQVLSDLRPIAPFMVAVLGGHVQEFSWAGELFCEFEYNSDKFLLHHDIERLPNGHILLIAWEKKTQREAIEAGRNPAMLVKRDYGQIV